MTTLFPVGLSCPQCRTEFRAATWASTNTFGPLDTDLYRHAGGASPLPAEVAQCPRCGFADWTARFPAGTGSIDRLPPGRENGGARYRALVERLGAAGEPALRLAEISLRGSWCARSERDAEQEEWLQERAASLFERAWSAGEAGESAAAIAYLLGELHRRLGRFSETDRWWAEAERRENPPEWLGAMLKVVRPLAAAGDRRNAVLPEKR